MDTVPGPTDTISQSHYEPGDLLIVIATGEHVTYRETTPDGAVEVEGQGKVRHYMPHEVRAADPPLEQVPSPEQVRARELAAGLADAGAFFAANPNLPTARRSDHKLYVFLWGKTARERIEQWVVAAHAAGARITEIDDEDNGGVEIWFGPVCWRVYTLVEYLGGEKPQTKRVRRKAHRPLLGDDTTGGAR